MAESVTLTTVVGVISGLFGGALGQSGAETMLPGLLILGIVPDFKTAAGTVLLAIVPPISLLAVIQYYKKGQVRVMTSIILFTCYFLAAFIGAYVTQNISNSTLEFVSGLYFMIIGLFFLWNSYTGIYGEKTDGKKAVTHAIGFKKLFTSTL
jgi:uncharacterized membrane protein YfcA